MNDFFSKLIVWKNGRLIPWQEATVPILSHGLSRGSGIFELFDIYYNSKDVYAFRMDKHLDRLFLSAKLLDIEFSFSRHEIEKAITETVWKNKINNGLVKIIAYFEEESITNLLLSNSKLSVAIFAVPRKANKGFDKCQGIDACFSSWRKIQDNMVPSKVKACANYLNGMLALKDAKRRGYSLGILLDNAGYVAEGSLESIFMVKDNVLKTPPVDGILSSITRMSVIEASKIYNICITEEKITPGQLLEADEIFTCKSTSKVLPVRRIEERILDTPPGPITKEIMQIMNSIFVWNDDRFLSWFQILRKKS